MKKYTLKNRHRVNSRKPHYNNDSDYTTNAPSYYDDLARKNQLVKYLAKKIWEYEEILDKTLEEIEDILNEYITIIDGKIEEIDHVIGEGFNDRIEILLREWLADGTLDHIINEVIFEDINNDIKELREDMENEIERVEIDYNNKINCINNDLLYLGHTKIYRGDI